LEADAADLGPFQGFMHEKNVSHIFELHLGNLYLAEDRILCFEVNFARQPSNDNIR
jgi:hypothetical protein